MGPKCQNIHKNRKLKKQILWSPLRYAAQKQVPHLHLTEMGHGHKLDGTHNYVKLASILDVIDIKFYCFMQLNIKFGMLLLTTILKQFVRNKLTVFLKFIAC